MEKGIRMTTVLTSPAELEEFLSDTEKVNAAVTDGTLKTILKDSSKAIVNRDKSIEEQVSVQLQQQMAEYIKSTGGQTTPIDLTAAKKARARMTKRELVNHGQRLTVTEHRNVKGAGASGDGIFEDFVDYLQAISPKAERYDEGAELKAKLQKLFGVQNAYSSGVPADGGFLIPEEYRSDVLSLSLESSVVRPRATVLPMSNLRLIVPSIDSTSNVSSIFGGLVAYWTEEAAALTASQAAFGRIVLDAKKLTAYAEFPNELVADAPAFGALIDRLMPQAIAWYEDVAFMGGSGVGEPLGFINCAASVSVAKQSGQNTGTILWENIVGMYARMLPSSLGSAVWIVSPDTFPELATMALAVGTAGSAIWLNNGTQGPPMTILGRPVIVSEKASALSTTGDVCFVDLSYYLIGDRQQMQATSSEEYKFGNDLMAYRIIERLDGRPWLNSAITPKNGGPTLSPFVQIATR